MDPVLAYIVSSLHFINIFWLSITGRFCRNETTDVDTQMWSQLKSDSSSMVQMRFDAVWRLPTSLCLAATTSCAIGVEGPVRLNTFFPKGTKSFMCDTNSYHFSVPFWATMNLCGFHLICTRLIAHAKLLHAFSLQRFKGTLFGSEKELDRW